MSRFLRVGLEAADMQAFALYGTDAYNVHRAFIPNAPSGHLDSLLVQGLWLVKEDPNCTAAPAAVTIGVLDDTTLDAHGERCVFADHERVHTLHYRSEHCQPNAPQLGEYSRSSPWRAGCLVVLLEAESRRALLEQLVADGRDLTLPLVVELEATAATSDVPDYELTSVHADLSVMLQDVSARDLIGEDARAALRAAAAEEWEARDRADLYAVTLRGLVVSEVNATQLAEFKNRSAELEAEAVLARQAHARMAARASQPCNPRTSVCGEEHARDPWTSTTGEKCRGASSFSLLPGDVCLRLDQLRNPDAETPAVAHEQFTDAPGQLLLMLTVVPDVGVEDAEEKPLLAEVAFLLLLVHGCTSTCTTRAGTRGNSGVRIACLHATGSLVPFACCAQPPAFPTPAPCSSATPTPRARRGRGPASWNTSPAATAPTCTVSGTSSAMRC
tara:strand:- start:4842 stop:6176 length:1335 start_codon:yes stop_codon:yes gene_type:complete